MKIVFFSTTLNHHQLPFCLAMEKLLGKGNFVFVASRALTKERKLLGFPDYNNIYDFVLKSYESDKYYSKSLKVAIDFDVAIFGHAPESFVKQRMKRNKLTFRYHERVFKNSRINILKPSSLRNIICRHTLYFNKNIYMLCASAYTAGDYRMAGAYINKCFKWGYFPAAERLNIKELLLDKSNNKINILWVGRFINLKNPKLAIEAAEYLMNKGLDFHMDIIGAGAMEKKLIDLITHKKLNSFISMHKSLPSDIVREFMKKAHIYLFTSDRREGWGVVLNESMNSGCAVVANKAIGSVPYLIKDGYNGFTYKNKSDFFFKVERLVTEEKLRNEFSVNAYNTIIDEWNAENAAKKLIMLIKNLVNKGNGKIFSKGVLTIDKGEL